MASLENLPEEILSSILDYTNSSPSVREVSRLFNRIDIGLDRTRWNLLNKDFPGWRFHPNKVFADPNVDLNTIWFAFRHSGANYQLLAKNTPNPEVLLQLIKSGYDNVDVIMKNAARLGLLNIVVKYSKRVSSFWNYVREVTNAREVRKSIIDFNTKFYNKIAKKGAIGGYIEIVEFAISQGANNFTTIAAEAAEKGNINIVGLVVKHKASNFDVIAINGARGGHFNVVEFAVHQGGNRMDISVFEDIAEYGAFAGSIEMVRLAMEHGARNTNEIAINAAAGGHENIVQLAINLGANEFKRMALEAAKGGFVNIVKEVTTKLQGATYNGTRLSKLASKKQFQDWTDIGLDAARNGHINVVELALKYGADPNRIAEVAAHNNHSDIVQLAIDRGADNVNDIAEYASDFGRVDILKLVIRYGADVWGDIAVGAARGGDVELLKEALKHGPSNYNKIAEGGASNCETEIVEIALSLGANNLDEIAAKAAENGCINIVRLCINRGVDNINLIAQEATNNDDIETVKLALNHGANNLGTIAGNAAAFGYINIVRLVIEHNVGRLILNRILNSATHKDRLEIVRLALEAGADVPIDVIYVAYSKAYFSIFEIMIRGRNIEGILKGFSEINRIM